LANRHRCLSITFIYGGLLSQKGINGERRDPYSLAAAAAPMLIRTWFMTAGSRVGFAWLGFSLSLAFHVADEAATGFLDVYNPTIAVLRRELGFWPMPAFDFKTWLVGLVIGIVCMLIASPLAFRNESWFRPIFYFLVLVAGILNGVGHVAATIAGRTVGEVTFARPAPGFYSSPLLLVAAAYSLIQLWNTRVVEEGAM